MKNWKRKMTLKKVGKDYEVIEVEGTKIYKTGDLVTEIEFNEMKRLNLVEITFITQQKKGEK